MIFLRFTMNFQKFNQINKKRKDKIFIAKTLY